MTKMTWNVKRVRATGLDSLAERLASRGAPEGTVLNLVGSKDSGSGSEVLRLCVILRPRRTSGLNALRMIGAFSVAQGVRKATGIVAWLQPPGKVVVDTTGKFAYVPSSFDKTIWGFTIDVTTGSLTHITGSPFMTSSPGDVVTIP